MSKRGPYALVDGEIWCGTSQLDTFADRYPALRHGDTVNSGAHTIHTGPLTPSALVFDALP